MGIIIGKVRDFLLWVIAMVDGKILTAHCVCMVGLWESCSHVLSPLQVVKVGTEKRDSLTVMPKSGYWILPPVVHSITYAPMKDINFIGKKKKASTNVLDDQRKSNKDRQSNT